MFLHKNCKKTKIVLCISGYDTNNFSGNSADCRTCYRLHTYPVSVISGIVSQNMQNVYNIYGTDELSFRSQIRSILEERKVDAVKIGMVFSENFFSIIREYIKKYSLKNIVYDPVMYSSSGGKLIQFSEKDFIKEIFISAKYLNCITPNILEVEKMLNIKITDYKDIQQSLLELHSMGFQNVIITGGHFFEKKERTTDYYFDGNNIITIHAKRLIKNSTRATGCTFSTAIACYLAKNYSIKKSFQKAKQFTLQCLKKGLPIEGYNGGTWQF